MLSITIAGFDIPDILCQACTKEWPDVSLVFLALTSEFKFLDIYLKLDDFKGTLSFPVVILRVFCTVTS